MIRDVTLTEGLVTTTFGVGCAALFGEPNPRRRRAVMEAAVENGIRHFDVAPMYGLGAAEQELGRFARGRRDRLIIATKFGITTTKVAAALARFQGPVRDVMRRVPALHERTRARALGPGADLGDLLYRKPGYGAAALRRSLDASLERLGTDYVDILLLHDPDVPDVPIEETVVALEDAVRRGQVRTWGVAGEWSPTVAVASSFGRVPVLQVNDDIAGANANRLAGLPTDGVVVYGVVGRVIRTIAAAWSSDAALQRRWQGELGVDCSRTDEVARLLLLDAADRYCNGTVLLGTTRPSRFAELAAVTAGEVTARGETLARFRALYRALPEVRQGLR